MHRLAGGSRPSVLSQRPEDKLRIVGIPTLETHSDKVGDHVHHKSAVKCLAVVGRAVDTRAGADARPFLSSPEVGKGTESKLL